MRFGLVELSQLFVLLFKLPLDQLGRTAGRELSFEQPLALLLQPLAVRHVPRKPQVTTVAAFDRHWPVVAVEGAAVRASDLLPSYRLARTEGLGRAAHELAGIGEHPLDLAHSITSGGTHELVG